MYELLKGNSLSKEQDEYDRDDPSDKGHCIDVEKRLKAETAAAAKKLKVETAAAARKSKAEAVAVVRKLKAEAAAAVRKLKVEAAAAKKAKEKASKSKGKETAVEVDNRMDVDEAAADPLAPFNASEGGLSLPFDDMPGTSSDGTGFASDDLGPGATTDDGSEPVPGATTDEDDVHVGL